MIFHHLHALHARYFCTNNLTEQNKLELNLLFHSIVYTISVAVQDVVYIIVGARK